MRQIICREQGVGVLWPLDALAKLDFPQNELLGRSVLRSPNIYAFDIAHRVERIWIFLAEDAPPNLQQPRKQMLSIRILPLLIIEIAQIIHRFQGVGMFLA
jgi:hypothetical protein